MDKFKKVAKGGWHPEKDSGGKLESGMGIRSSVKGMLGRNDSSSAHPATRYDTPYVRKDPSAFAPPPPTKRYENGETPLSPPPRTNSAATATSTTSSAAGARRAPAPPVPARTGSPATAGAAQQEQDEQPARHQGPFRADKSGKDTSRFAPPPPRPGAAGAGVGARSPPPPPPAYTPRSSDTQTTTGAGSPATVAKKPPPSLPPRLPPRGASAENSNPAAPPVYGAEDGYINTTAANRLAKAGISVPSLGISNSTAAASPAPQIPLRTTTNTTTKPPPATGTTWAEKQAALRTASNFQKDPSKVSFSDMRAAASTADNFRQRHGEQVAQGAKMAEKAEEKWSVRDRVAGLSSGGAPAAGGGIGGLMGKKAPPPVPVKKTGAVGAPPPVPLGSKPKPS